MPFRYPYLLLFLSLVFLPSLVEAKVAKLAGAAAGDAQWKKSCELRFQQFESKIAERRKVERPEYDRERRLRERHATFDEISADDNRHYIELAQRANRGLGRKDDLWVDIENAVLKDLNDKVVLDKERVTNYDNFFKHLLWTKLSRDPVLSKDAYLGPQLRVRYQDFKAAGRLLIRNTPENQQSMKAALAEVNEKFADYLGKLPEAAEWEKRAKGVLTRDRRNWHQGGMGHTPDQAGLASRCARTMLGAGGVGVLRGFEECEAMLEAAAKNVGRYQAWTEKRFAAVPAMLTQSEPGRKVLSAEAIEAIKKAKPFGEGEGAALEGVRRDLSARFGTPVSTREAAALRNMVDTADRFSPGLLQAVREEIDMGQQAVGVLSADFKGQNARNLEETLKAISRTRNEPMAARVRAVREGEETATATLEQKKERFGRAVEKVFPGLRSQFSGDDGMAFLGRPVTAKEREAFTRAWVAEGGSPGDLRLTYEEFRYVDTGREIPAQLRSPLVGSAETVEKNLRADLLAVLGRERLNSLQIFVTMKAREQGKNIVDLQLIGAGGLSPAEVERVKTLLGSYDVGSVQSMP